MLCSVALSACVHLDQPAARVVGLKDPPRKHHIKRHFEARNPESPSLIIYNSSLDQPVHRLTPTKETPIPTP